jgi:hypothetical protein
MAMVFVLTSLGLSVTSLAYVMFVWGRVRRIESRMTRKHVETVPAMTAYMGGED